MFWVVPPSSTATGVTFRFFFNNTGSNKSFTLPAGTHYVIDDAFGEYVWLEGITGNNQSILFAQLYETERISTSTSE